MRHSLLLLALLCAISFPSCKDNTNKSDQDKPDTNEIKNANADTTFSYVSFTNPSVVEITQPTADDAQPIAAFDFTDDDKCSDILVNGTMETYQFKDEKKFKQSIRLAITMDREQLKRIAERREASADIPVPMAESIVMIGANYSEDKDKLEQMRIKYIDSSTLDIETSDLIWINNKIASDKIVSAWEKCIALKWDNQRGMTAYTSGDIKKEFLLNINWFPQSRSDPAKIKIANVVMTSNVKKSGEDILKKGAWLETYTGLSQRFQRKNNDPVSIRILVSGYKELKIDLPLIKPEPANPKYKMEWSKTDESNHPYYQVFQVTTTECKDCRQGGHKVGGTLTINDPKGRIYDVKYSCDGVGCSWSYSVCGDSPGRAICGKILNDKQYEWHREWVGAACYEYYTVYYEKLRKVCIENCK